MGEREGEIGLLAVGGEPDERTHALALGGSRLERPRQLRERAARRRACDLAGVERRCHLVPEGTRLARRAVVRRGLTHQIEAVDRTRARRVEEVAVAADRVGPLEPAAERAALVVVEKRGAAFAPRQRAFLEPEHEDDVEASRPRPQQVEDDHTAGLRPRRGDLHALERGDQLLGAERAGEPLPVFELSEQGRRGAEAAEVEP